MAAERKVGEATYRVDKLPPRQAQRLFLRLSKILGPAIQSLGDIFTMENEEERDRRALLMIGTFLQNLDIDEADSLLVDITTGAQIKEDSEYTEIIFDVHFHDLIEAWKVAFFVLEVQFKSFFDAVNKSGIGQTVKSRLQSPK